MGGKADVPKAPTFAMTPLAEVYEAIEKQLPGRLIERVTITILSDPYFIAPRVTFVPKRRPDLTVEARLGQGYKIPDSTIAEICLWA